MKISRVLIVSILVYLIILWGLFAYNGANWLINFSTIIMLTSISLLFLLILLIYPDKHPVLLLFIIITLAYFNLRILGLIVEPERLYDQFTPATADDVNLALIYVFFGIIFSVAGILTANKIFQLKSPSLSLLESERIFFLKQPIILLCGVIFLVELNVIYSYMVMGLSRHGIEALQMSTLTKIIHTLIDVDTFLIAFIIIGMEQWNCMNKKVKVLSLFVILGYILMRVIISSKAGIYYPVLFWLIYKLSKERDFKVNVKKLALIILPLFLMAVLSYNAGKQLRQNWLNIRDQQISFEYIYGSLGEKDWSYYLNVLSPLSRLEGIDPLINIINEKGINVNKYINLTNEVKSFLNLALPGKPFRVPLTSQSYAIVYVPVDESLYLDDGVYTTYIFTMWGLFFALFGATGGLLGMFLFMLIFTAMYNLIYSCNSKYRIFLLFLCVYAVYWNLISFGFDFLMDLVGRSLLQGGLIILALQFVNVVKRRESIWPIKNTILK